MVLPVTVESSGVFVSIFILLLFYKMEFSLASRTGGVPRVLDRRISNAGRLQDIRKRDPQQVFKVGGIQKFSTLGSQNAITYVPIAYQTKESGTQTNLPGQTKKDSSTGTDSGTSPDGRPLLGKGAIQSEASKKMMEERKKEGLLGTTQSEASKIAMGVRKVIQDEKEAEKKAKEEERAKADSAVEPTHEPPYYLPEEQGQMDEMVQYLKDKYGVDISRKYVDDLTKDSKAFSESVEKAKVIGRAINEWRSKDLGKEWMLNQLKEVGKWVLSQVADLAKNSVNFGTGAGGKIAGEVSKVAIDELKKLIEEKVLSPEHVEEQMKAIQDALFSARPYWKAKWDKLVSAEIARARKAFHDYLKEGFGQKGDGGKSPFGYMSTKKEKPAEEAPKKRKLLKKSVAIKI